VSKVVSHIRIGAWAMIALSLLLSFDVVAQNYNMGGAGNTNGSTVSTCSGNFYDSGGPAGNYANNQNVTVTYCSNTPGQQIRFNFSSINLANGEILSIYNGANTSAPLLYQCVECNSAAQSFVSVNGCLTFTFTSNNAANAAGWSAVISCFTPIANDNCSGAIALPVGPTCTNTVASNTGATPSAGVPAPTCSFYSGGDVWYSFVAPAGGAVNINTSSIAGGPTDMAMALYSGACGSLTQIACDDDLGPGLMPLINSTGLIPGQTYYLRLWEFGNDVFGNFNLCLVEAGSTDANVDCSSSTQLCSDSQVNGASSGFGTQDLGASNAGCLGVEHQSNWFYAQVTTAGVFSFTINPQVATNDYDFAVWQYPPGTAVPCPPTGQPTRCSFSATPGPTGLGNGATDNSENALGNAWVAPINVAVGDILVVLIDNFSATTTPFTLDFTGTASLNCNPVPLECSISGLLQACVGATSQLTATGIPAATNPWISSNAAVANVSNTGLVTGISAGTVTITYTDSEGCQASQVFTVNPRAVISNIILQTCSGTPFSETPTSDAPNIIPLGTTYSWSAPAGSGFSGGAAGSGNLISGTLTNSSATAVTATYTVTATSGIAPNQCTNTFNLIVTVNPRPSIPNLTRAICSGQSFSVLPVNGINGVVPAGTTYSWSAPSGVGFTGGVAGSGSSISGTLTNTGNAPVTASYTITAVYGTAPNACSSVFNLTVTVHPLPVAVVNANSPICAGQSAVFTITGPAGAVVTYNLNGGSDVTTTLIGGTATVSVPGVTAPQVLNLVSINSGTAPICSQSLNSSTTVALASEIVPVFNYTNATYCEDAVVIQPILNTTSLNGITGAWTPSSISTSAPGATQYVFTPNAGQCATDVSFSVTIGPSPVTSAIFHN